ncbi:MAG TPA: hypothetical protein VN914_04250, partial [Polyangia bacterium]|nr:hypothetical protein [Polyangia bacterium]
MPVAWAEKSAITVLGGLALAAVAIVLIHFLLRMVHRWSGRVGEASPERELFEARARRISRRWAAYLEVAAAGLAMLLAFSPLSS